jgi:predicted porin
LAAQWGGVAVGLLAGVAHTQTASAQSAAADESLTWHGITLYGIIDAGIQYDTHTPPFNDFFITGGNDLVQKNSNQAVLGLTSNPMSQSRVGLQGKEDLHFLDFSGIFKVETYFNPTTGQLTNALKSLAQNNGRALTQQSTGVDSSLNGQPFEQGLVGISSPTYGTLTFGRQNTTLADLIAKYDPQQTSYAFSLLGFSGTPAGGGDTQDRRFDNSIKYSGRLMDMVHVGLHYKFQNSTAATYASGGTGPAFSAFEVQVGADHAGLSVDAFYTKVRDAIAASALSAAQVTALPAGLTVAESVNGTISDNASYGAMGSYDLGGLTAGTVPMTVYGGYQHITYMNPSIALPVGFDLEGFTLGAVSNTTYAKADKILKVYWAGLRYSLTKQTTVAVAYYGETQDSFATGTLAGCTTAVNGSCSGNLDVFSISLDYKFSKRFDSYIGAMYSSVSNGLANGYLNTNNIDPTIGMRFSF